MKIIHVVSTVKIEASGPSQSVKGLCQSLFNLDQDVTLASMDYPISEDFRGLEFEMVYPVGLGSLKVGRSPKLFRWLKSNVIGGKTVLIHNHGMWQIMALYASRLRNNFNFYLVQSPRNALAQYSLDSGSKLKPLFWKIFQHRALKKVDCFHATSESEYHDIRRLGFNQPVAIIPNGVDVPELIPKLNNSKIKFLTYLGRLHPEKGIENLLSAWALIYSDFKDWRLQIIGPTDNKYAEYLKDYVVKANLMNIEFLGPKYGQEKLEAYAKSDLYILPSPSENFGMTIAESLACGTPVIATKGAPWSELPARNCGWWIDGDPDSLAKGIHEGMSLSAGQRHEMGMLGREWMIESFSWEGRGEKMIEVYNWLANPKMVQPDCIKVD